MDKRIIKKIQKEIDWVINWLCYEEEPNWFRDSNSRQFSSDTYQFADGVVPVPVKDLKEELVNAVIKELEENKLAVLYVCGDNALASLEEFETEEDKQEFKETAKSFSDWETSVNNFYITVD